MSRWRRCSTAARRRRRRSTRSRGLVPAEDVDVFAFRPAGATAAGWTADDVPQLLSTLDDVFGRAPPLLIDGAATPTTIPSDQLAWYPKSQQPDPSAVSAKDQGNAYARLISSTACSTTISAIVLDRLVDDNAFARAGERHRLCERRRESVGAARLGRRRPSRSAEPSSARVWRRVPARHAAVPRRARRVGLRIGRARLRPRLPLRDRARRTEAAGPSPARRGSSPAALGRSRSSCRR